MDSDDDGAETEGNDAAEAPGDSEASGGSTDPGEFGPSSELVLQFIEKVRGLTTEQALELAAFWKKQPKNDLRAAHEAVKELAEEDEAWRSQVKAAQDLVAGSLTTRLVRRPTTRPDLMEKDASARKAALPAAVDAVTALVLGDLLEPEDAELLYRPWADAIGEPALPEFEDDGQE
jgi:hypothetical protein